MSGVLLLFLLFALASSNFQSRVIKAIERPPNHFTQGLFFDSPNTLVESTGLYSESRIQRIKASNGRPVLTHKLMDTDFGEGCTMIGQKIYQLTWMEKKCFVYDKKFKLLETKQLMPQIREGWGATTDGTYLYVSEGSAVIYVIDPKKWKIVNKIAVHDGNGTEQNDINAMQYVNGYIFANVYMTDYIVKINANTGLIIKRYSLEGLHNKYDLPEGSRSGHVLNGIAYRKETNTFYITGKKWKFIFEVSLN
eukprot:TRINITY_DN8260_c0_g1_i1.p1 TRINITY_DN8260_c0_g1~~TRINITY_DN8260_c0_g1_i1.p1  ORF type:complete len:251 (+),score=41.42 TRINITY_DN8260_c0_g1_i1:91-843(+)